MNGAATNVMLQSFGPYAPATILVPRTEAERAAKILRHLLLGEAAPEPRGDERATPAPASAMPTPLRTRLGALAATLLVAGGLLGVASVKPPPPAERRPAKLEVVAIADGDDPFTPARNLEHLMPSGELPDALELPLERAPIGLGELGERDTRSVSFARVSLLTGESVDDAIRRGDAWVRRIQLPPGKRFAWEPSSDWDDENGKFVPSGARTFVLEGEPVLTNKDIVEALPAVNSVSGTPDVYIAITLTPEAGQRFARFTRERVNRRVAILLDGRVNSAPVIKTAIDGGKISITMGAYDFEKQMKEARARRWSLAEVRALTSRCRDAPCWPPSNAGPRSRPAGRWPRPGPPPRGTSACRARRGRR